MTLLTKFEKASRAKKAAREKPALVFYWGVGRGTGVLNPVRAGHIAMQLSDGTTYISLFPAGTHEHKDDVRDEGREADRIYELYGLNEKAIKNWWEREQNMFGYQPQLL